LNAPSYEQLWSIFPDVVIGLRASPLVYRIMAVAMIVFGIAELVTAFRHEFFGLRGAELRSFTAIGCALGLCYVLAGILLLVHSRRALWAATVLLAIDVVGRVALVATGLFPVDTAMQRFGIVAGTVIAAAFGITVGVRSRSVSAAIRSVEH
jgi:hypothetical protein